jgi:hypothetical protein
MNKKLRAALCIAAALAAATFVLAQSKTATPAALFDPRVDKLLEQNEKILKNQDEILKQLGVINERIFIMYRRSS